MTANGPELNKLIMIQATRESMDKLCAASHNGTVPSLDKEGSDTLMGTLTKQLSTGRIPLLGKNTSCAS